MKSVNKLAFRKLKSNKFILIGLSLIVIIGVAFFVILFTISTRYGETTEQYFRDFAYADCTFYGSFDDGDLSSVKLQPGITSAEGRYVKDYRTDEVTFRLISLTENINKPYFYSGEMPSGKAECLILKKNADAMNIKIGDTITIKTESLEVKGLIASPEYIYLVKNERSMMSDPENFGVVFVDKDFFKGSFNEIIIKGTGFDHKQIGKDIKAEKSLLQNQQLNYTGYKADLDQIKSFAFIFPGIFALLVLIVVYVVLKRTAVKERKQIAIYKALGANNREIIKIYLTQFIITFFIAAIIGCLITMFAVGIIINMFSSMFVMPLLSYHLYPYLWIGAVGVSLLLCILPGILSLLGILKMQPTEAMRPKTRKGGKKILLERISRLWKRFSFNTKVTLKSMFRSKARFFSVFLGIAGTCALLILSFGFNDSIQNTRNAYFDEFAKYDLIVNFEPLPFDVNDESINALSAGDEYSKALQFPASIKNTECIVTIVSGGFDFLDFNTNKLKNGIIVPEYFANKWNVKEGDSINIENYSYNISQVITQTMALSLYANYDYIKSVNADFMNVYNTIYVRGQNLENLTSYLNANEIMYSTIEDDTATFTSVSQTLNMIIFIMLICALILGITVLYTVGLMNLSARENEYMLMNTLGYSRKKLMLIYIKETLIQIILALPLGLLFGNLLLYAIQGKFSNSSFVVKASVFPLSYLLSFGIVLLMSAIMYLITNRQIKKLNITEGLKMQDD